MSKHGDYMWWKVTLKKMLVSEKELSDVSFQRLTKVLIYMKNKLIDSDKNMYLNVDSLIDISNIITGSNNISLRKVNVKPYGCDKIYVV